MAIQARVSDLKKQLENLFPGKWMTGNERSRNLQTGIAEFDQGITRGIARKRITEWVGSLSSGKTSVLRTAITNWCNAGLNVAYIDAEGRLLAADWAFVQREDTGKFWIVRPPDEQTAANACTVVPLVSKKQLLMQEVVWSADQFVRSNAFDIVVLDLGSINPSDNKRKGVGYSAVSSRVYARLQRSLDRSKSALIVVRDTQPEVAKDNSWGAYARFGFDWGASVRVESGLAGLAMITPSIRCNVQKDGLSQVVEVNLGGSVQNRLFTHPQVSDRRTSKG